MNKIFKNCLFGVIASMAIGLSALALGSQHSLIEAEAITGSMHYYERISDPNDLHIGDHIVISTFGGRVFDAPAGNPRFYRMSPVSGFNDDISKIYADESQIKRFELGQGATAGSYSLKCMENTGFGNLKGLYLYYTEDRNAVQPHDKEDVGYYMTNMCFKSYKDGVVEGHSSWEFVSDGGYGFYINRADEPDKENYHLCYGGSYTRPALSYGYTDAVLLVFKEITLDSTTIIDVNPIIVSQTPDRSSYYVGDQVDLTGLQILIRMKDSSVIYASYNNSPSFFKVMTPAQVTGRVTVEYCGITFSVPIEILETPVNSLNYNLVKSPLNDYRGTYVIGCDDGYDFYGLKTREISDSPSSKSNSLIAPISRLSGNVVNIPTEDVYEEEMGNVNYPALPCTIERRTVSNQSYYFIKCEQGYLSYSTAELHEGDLIVKSAGQLTTSDAVTISSNGSISMNGQTLVWNSSFFFGSGYLNARLYRLMPSADYQTHIDNFVSTFISGTADACAAFNMTNEIWSDMADAFNVLTLDEQAYFANLEYLHNLEDTTSAENVVDRYDYIVAKYGFDDFMNRKDANTWKDYVHDSDDTLPDEIPSLSRLIGEEVSASVIYIAIIITAVLSISSVLFFLNRRKHQ